MESSLDRYLKRKREVLNFLREVRASAQSIDLQTAIKANPKPALIHLGLDHLQQVTSLWARLPEESKVLFSGGILIPLGLLSWAGALRGYAFPDVDIKLFGIGMHRFWLLHSALAAWVLREFVTYADKSKLPRPLGKILAATGSGAALGIGIHLVKDGSFGLFDGQKSVVFGIPGLWTKGTLIEGTLVDDNIWLLVNGLWAMKISSDLAVLAFGEDVQQVKAWVEERFAWRNKP